MDDLSLTVVVWPAAFLIGAIAGMVIFRRPISDAINRIRRLGRDGADLAPPSGSTPAEQQKSVEAVDASGVPALPAAAGDSPIPAERALPPPSEVHAPVEQEIIGFLENSQLAPEVERAWLIRGLAVARITRGHERIYRLILGSQLQLLLETNTGVAVSLQRAREMFDGARERYPDIYTGFEFDTWVTFPTNQGLMRRETLPDGRVVLEVMPLGRDFLHYLVSTGLTGQKVG